MACENWSSWIRQNSKHLLLFLLFMILLMFSIIMLAVGYTHDIDALKTIGGIFTVGTIIYGAILMFHDSCNNTYTTI